MSCFSAHGAGCAGKEVRVKTILATIIAVAVVAAVVTGIYAVPHGEADPADPTQEQPRYDCQNAQEYYGRAESYSDAPQDVFNVTGDVVRCE